jgi:hypothetical protein
MGFASSPPLIPAQAGIQIERFLGPRFRGDERNVLRLRMLNRSDRLNLDRDLLADQAAHD